MADIIVQQKRYNSSTQSSDNLIPNKAITSNNLYDGNGTVPLGSVTSTEPTYFISYQKLLKQASSTWSNLDSSTNIVAFTFNTTDFNIQSMNDIKNKHIKIGFDYEIGTSIGTSSPTPSDYREYQLPSFDGNISTILSITDLLAILNVNINFSLIGDYLTISFGLMLRQGDTLSQARVKIGNIYLIN